jgi:5-methylcytosine-specific restriction protein A
MSPAPALRFCAEPRCRVLVERGRCDTHCRTQQQHHVRFKQGDCSYKSTRWLKARARFLGEHPLCESCREQNRVTPANTVDHREAHRGDVEKFWNEDNWAASCASCHSKKTARETHWRAK